MKDPLDDKKEGLDRAWEVARLNDMIKVARGIPQKLKPKVLTKQSSSVVDDYTEPA